MHSQYEDELDVAAAVREGRHRGFVGGLWEELGRLQLDFLISQGLRPRHRLIDIGAGALRFGVHAVRYLSPGHYFATDRNAALLRAGWELELDEGGRARLPWTNIDVRDDFDLSFAPAPLDFGIAQSVFTHLPVSALEACLSRAASVFDTNGRLFVTVFLAPEGLAQAASLSHKGGVTSFPDRDPFHHRLTELQVAAREAWTFNLIGDWSHPRGQSMVEYVRR